MNFLEEFEQGECIPSTSSQVTEILHIPTGKNHILKIQKFMEGVQQLEIFEQFISSLQNTNCEHIFLPKIWMIEETSNDQDQEIYQNNKEENILRIQCISEKASYSLNELILRNIKNSYTPDLEETIEIFLPILKGVKEILKMKLGAFININPNNILFLNDGQWVIDPTTIYTKTEPKFDKIDKLFYHPKVIQNIEDKTFEEIYEYQIILSMLVFMTSYKYLNEENINIETLQREVKRNCKLKQLELFNINFENWPAKQLNLNELIGTLEQSKLTGKVDQNRYTPQRIRQKIDQMLDFIENEQFSKSIQKLRDISDDIYFVEQSNEKEQIVQDVQNIIIELSNLVRDDSEGEDLVNMIYKISPQISIQHSEAHFAYGNLLCNLDEYKAAIELANSAGKTYRTGDLYYNIGVACMCQLEYQESIDYFKKSLDIRIYLYGAQTEIVADTYHNLGFIYGELKQFILSLQSYLRSKSIRIRLNGIQNEKTADALYNIGWTYMQMNQFDLAYHNMEAALKIRKEIHGVSYSKLADSYHNMGLILLSRGEFDFALGYLKKGTFLQEENSYILDERLALGYQAIAQCFFKLRRFYEAKIYYIQAIEMEKALGNDETSYLESQLNKCEDSLDDENNALNLTSLLL